MFYFIYTKLELLFPLKSFFSWPNMLIPSATVLRLKTPISAETLTLEDVKETFESEMGRYLFLVCCQATLPIL